MTQEVSESLTYGYEIVINFVQMKCKFNQILKSD